MSKTKWNGPFMHDHAPEHFRYGKPGDQVIFDADGLVVALVVHDDPPIAADHAPLFSAAPAMAEALEEAKEALLVIRSRSADGAMEGYTKPELWAEALFKSHAQVHAAIEKIDAALSLAHGERQ